jgi:hypothetical protein
MLSVVMLSVIMLSVIKLSVVMLSVVMLSVIMLNVVSPFQDHPLYAYYCSTLRWVVSFEFQISSDAILGKVSSVRMFRPVSKSPDSHHAQHCRRRPGVNVTKLFSRNLRISVIS